MPILDNLYRIFLWSLSFGVLAYALFRWGKAGFTGLPGGDFIGEFFKMIIRMIRERPLLMALIPIISLLVWLSYIMNRA